MRCRCVRLSLHRRRIGALERRGGQALDDAVLLIRLLETRQAVQRGVAGGVHRDQRGGLTGLDQPQGCRQQRVHQPVVADQRGLVGSAAQQVATPSPLRRVVERVHHGQVLLGRDGEGSGTAASRRAIASCVLRRRGGGSRVSTVSRMRSWRKRRAGCAPGSSTRSASSRAGSSRSSRTPAPWGWRSAGRQLGSPLRGTPSPRPARATAPAGRRYAPRPIRRLGLAQTTADRRAVPPPSGGRGRQHPVAPKGVQQFEGLVGVAGRMALDGLDQTRRGGAVHVQRLGDHRDEARHRQVGQAQMLHRALVMRSGQQRGERMRHIDLTLAERARAAGPRSAPRSARGRTDPAACGPPTADRRQTRQPGVRARRSPAAAPRRSAAPVPVRSADRRGSGGTASSAANSGTTAVVSPALGPSASKIRSRRSASSSSGSASSSRPRARNS